MTEKKEMASLTRKEKLGIEGYKALMQYGCQMSADHISTDRVMIPLSLAPALLVLAPPNEGIASNWAETWILLGGFVFTTFWMLRTRRSEKRLYAIWDILRLIEGALGFEAHLTLQAFMDDPILYGGRFRRWTYRDFTLKEWFGWFVLAFYVSCSRTCLVGESSLSSVIRSLIVALLVLVLGSSRLKCYPFFPLTNET